MRRAARLLGAFVAPALLCCADPGQGWRRTGPRPEQNVAVRIPVFSEVTLDNGLRVQVYEEPYLPLVSVQLVLAAGSAAVPAAQAGLPRLSHQLMLRGTEAQDSDVALDSLGARPELHEDTEGAAIGLEVRSQHVEEALDVLAQVVQQPRLSEADFARVRARAVDELAGRMAAPAYAGRRALREVVYGAEHPHGLPPEGTQETLRALTRADVVDFHRRHVGPRTVALVLAGRVTPAQALRWARQRFGSWRAPAVRAPPPRPPAAARREVVHVVPRPGLAQTVVILGRSVAQGGDPLALQQVGRLAGGLIGRRLREAWGASYGVTTTLEEHRGEALFSMAASVQAEHGGAALAEALRQLDRLRQRGYEALDLNLDGAGGRGALALYQVRATSVWRISARYSGLGTSAQAAAALFLLMRPASFHAQQIRRAQSLLGADLQAAGASSFDPEQMQVVLVGDPALLRAQVQGPLREIAAR